MKISVICPSYNRSSFLEACITPVMALPNAEFVLVDDGSTDGTRETLVALQSRFGSDRIIYLRLEGNQGAQVARNRGMEVASGEAMLFCDSDDVPVSPGVAEMAAELGKDASLDYAYGKVVMTDDQLTPLEGRSPIGSAFTDFPMEYAGYHWHTMGALYRKSYLVKVGPWNPTLTGSQDWEYQARVKLAGGRCLFVNMVVGYWRQHKGGRVGAREFRADYVRSVVNACGVIFREATDIGKCDNVLKRRLAKKLIIHALESGAHCDKLLKSYCLSNAALVASDDKLFLFIVGMLKQSSSWLDQVVWDCFVK